jgi:CubicO group peptidase (beta-lactamase class C family)
MSGPKQDYKKRGTSAGSEMNTLPDRREWMAKSCLSAIATARVCIGVLPLLAVPGLAEATQHQIASPASEVARKALPEFDNYVASAMQAVGIPGLAIAVVKDDKVIYARGYGTRNASRPLELVTPETVFGIGSVTKSFTATAMAMLVDEHKVGWDVPVKEYLPYFETYDRYVTSQLSSRDIACHRTGIEEANYLQWRPTNAADDRFHPTRADIVRAFKYLKASSGFRTTFAYRNVPWEVLGAVIEAKSGMTWDRFVHDRIFAPLGMKRSSTSVNETRALRNVSSVHIWLRGKLTPINMINADVPGPMGAINSTALDLARYVRFQLGNGAFNNLRLLKTASFKELHEPQIVDNEETLTTGTGYTQEVSYALGWWVQDYRGWKLVQHSGEIVGGSATVAFLPGEHFGVVVLANGDSVSMVRALSLRAIDTFLGFTPYDWAARAVAFDRDAKAAFSAERARRARARVIGTEPSHALSAYVGVYHNGAYGNLRIVQNGNRLTASLWTFTGVLSHWNYDTFNLKWDESDYYLHVIPERQSLVRFDTAATGVVDRVHFLSLGDFTRVRPGRTSNY